jgi:mevalonate pyrophosphate decarboxylase
MVQWYHHAKTISSPCGTAIAQAFANIAFIKYWGNQDWKY